MLAFALTGLIGMLTTVVLFALTGLLPHDYRWWLVMVPASWLWAALYHWMRRGDVDTGD